MNKLGDKKQEKKYLQIANEIKGRINNGEYQVGENIPTVRQLSEIYKVNPQTICKATAYLSSQGYLDPVQGSGLKVCISTKETKLLFIPMLVDKSRSILMDLDKQDDYHSKDIHLAYLMYSQKKNFKTDFIIYNCDDLEVNSQFEELIKEANGFIVQGDLPKCYFKAIEEKNIPLALINRMIPNDYSKKIGSILISEKNIETLINYLISLGHKKILYAISNDFEKSIVTEQRFNKMLLSCSNWKNELDVEVKIFEFSSDNEDSINKLNELINDGFTAAWAYNDISALALYPLVRSCDKKIPLDFSIAGFDDIHASQLSDPPLTTIKVNRYKLVENALRILDKLIKTDDFLHIDETLETEFIIRRSTFRAKQ